MLRGRLEETGVLRNFVSEISRENYLDESRRLDSKIEKLTAAMKKINQKLNLE